MSLARRLKSTFVLATPCPRPPEARLENRSELRSAFLVELTLWAECACGARLALAHGFTATCVGEEQAIKAGAKAGWRLAAGDAVCPACLENSSTKLLPSGSNSLLISSVIRNTTSNKQLAGKPPLPIPSPKGAVVLRQEGAAALRRVKKGNAK